MKIIIKLLKKKILSLVPRNCYRLYRWCKWYVDQYNGENNSNIDTNGELRFMQRNLPQCTTVFDVGANVGRWTARALKSNSKLELHCFEPSQATYQGLLSNQFPPNVTCNNFGMGSASGKAELFVFENGAGLNSLYQRQGLESSGLSTPQRRETICLDTVDHYCRERGIQTIDFLKIDVEGHEMEVFKGSSSMLAQGQVKMIQFEYGGCNIDAGVLLKDIFEFFGDFDYTLYKIYPKGLRLVTCYDQRLENFQYQNWAAVKNGHSFLL